MTISLLDLKPRETATVMEIKGGQALANRLNALGIRPGKQITKVSSHFSNGPVTVLVDRAQIAIGHSMADKIMLSIDRT